jgi:hypothetical protein
LLQYKVCKRRKKKKTKRTNVLSSRK